jgi:hypothetical protein
VSAVLIAIFRKRVEIIDALILVQDRIFVVQMPTVELYHIPQYVPAKMDFMEIRLLDAIQKKV